MNINILTFHREINYGANLQAYALRQYLIALGHDVRFIDYRHTSDDFTIADTIKRWVGKSISSTSKKIAERRREMNIGPIFEKFQNEFLPTTSSIYRSPDSIKNNPPVAECYIVGSDQVWSTKLIKNEDLPVFMLDFGNQNVKRIAYAVSSGGELFTPEFQQEVKKYLSRFDAIGAREETLVDHLSDIEVIGAKWVPDPTILLDWYAHIDLQSITPNPRIGLFLLNKSNYEKVSIAGTRCCEETFSDRRQFLNIAKENIDPKEWVKAIASVRLLITDSYHAVLFAVYTRTPFVFLRWGSEHNRDGRIISFLSKIGLEEQAKTSVDLVEENHIKSCIAKWEFVSTKLEEMRSIAKEYLRLHIN